MKPPGRPQSLLHRVCCSRRVLSTLVGLAFLLFALLYIKLVLQQHDLPPKPDVPKKVVPAVTHVYVGHIQSALEDITGKQETLCRDLYELQSYLGNASRAAAVKTELVAYSSRESSAGARFSFDKDAKLTATGVLLTTHFTSLEDPVHGHLPGREAVVQEAFGYMDLWYRTVVAVGVPAVVFHDRLSADFVSQYTTDLIKFIKVDISRTHYSSNDIRFDIFNEWITCCADVQYVLFTDIRDVRLARNPFDAMAQLHDRWDLFVNTDRNNNWMQDRFRELAYKNPGFEVLLNAGVFGGKKDAVLDVLATMLREFARLYQKFYNYGDYKTKNFDMAVFNMALLQHISSAYRIFTGSPFCGGQVQCELFFQCDYWIYHKYAQPGELPPCRSLLDAEDQSGSGVRPEVYAQGDGPSDAITPVWTVVEQQERALEDAPLSNAGRKAYPWQALTMRMQTRGNSA
ncbi:hypothetical protein WJX72_006266 [[Myrmecia] bisecta]|uniref:Uncharacterized protein n=1 Tax=[Myrmecia] bisecta TaxID=41462 RepID=A0AAW1PWY6_9CHLO